MILQYLVCYSFNKGKKCVEGNAELFLSKKEKSIMSENISQMRKMIKEDIEINKKIKIKSHIMINNIIPLMNDVGEEEGVEQDGI